MANNPYTLQKQAAQRELLSAQQRLQNARTDAQRRSIMSSVQNAQSRLLRAEQNEYNYWNTHKK